MKRTRQKTPNAQIRTPNIEWMARWSVREDAPVYNLSEKRHSTLNAQRSTLNAQPVAGNPHFDLEDRLLEFSARIIRLADSLPNSRATNHLAGQLLRCGTSPYGNHGEIEAAESRKDFIHKLKICLKELRESRRWLRLAGRLKTLRNPASLAPCLNESEQLIRIFVASVRTAEK